MKKYIILAAMLLTSVSVFAASKKSIVCTTFPQYDWISNILGTNSGIELTLLQKNGTDLHSYQPTVKDITKISACDLFVYIGGESDVWVEKALKNARNKNMVVINIMETLGDRVHEEEIVEGMQGEDEHHHDDDDEDEDEHHHHAGEHHHHDNEEDEEEIEYDEHVWLSLKNAAFLTEVLSGEVAKLDAEKASVFKANAEAYILKLNALDKDYEEVVASSKYKTLVFGDRFPFRYLTDDYGLKYYAAFVGCSAESDASFETVIFLAKKLDELGLNSIIKIENSDNKIAKTVVSNTKAKNMQILELDSLQSVTAKEISDGKTYLNTMQKNLAVLKTALN